MQCSRHVNATGPIPSLVLSPSYRRNRCSRNKRRSNVLSQAQWCSARWQSPSGAGAAVKGRALYCRLSLVNRAELAVLRYWIPDLQHFILIRRSRLILIFGRSRMYVYDHSISCAAVLGRMYRYASDEPQAFPASSDVFHPEPNQADNSPNASVFRAARLGNRSGVSCPDSVAASRQTIFVNTPEHARQRSISAGKCSNTVQARESYNRRWSPNISSIVSVHRRPAEGAFDRVTTCLSAQPDRSNAHRGDLPVHQRRLAGQGSPLAHHRRCTEITAADVLPPQVREPPLTRNKMHQLSSGSRPRSALSDSRTTTIETGLSSKSQLQFSSGAKRHRPVTESRSQFVLAPESDNDVCHSLESSSK